jgi:death-on-curing family protein
VTIRRVVLIDAALVADIAKRICGPDYRCYDLGKVESALHSAFYPGSYPFAHGGVATIAGALAFYLTKAHAFMDGNKRTALVAATTFLALNGHDLVYPFDTKTGHNELADAVEGCAAGTIGIDELKDWFERHKVVT